MRDNKIFCRQAEGKDIPLILELFENVFKKKLSKKYYINKYKKQKNYNSYLLIDTSKNKIIGHVGYSIVKININKKFYKVALRFSSMIRRSYQKQGFYKKLLIQSFKILKQQKISNVICWPNKINIIGTKKHIDFIYHKKINKYSLSIQGKQKFNLLNNKSFKICNMKNLYIFNKRRTKINYSLIKNTKYIQERYFKLNLNNNFYFFEFKNNIIVFSKKNNEEINILDFLYNNKYFEKAFDNFLETLKYYKIILNIWINPRNLKIYNLLLKKNFKKTDLIFNLCLYKINHKNALPANFLENYNYSMGDTDVF